MGKSIVPKKWEFYSQFNLEHGTFSEEWSSRLQALLLVNGITAIKITVEEIVQWDIAKMRGFLHGVIVPAFVAKFSENCQYPIAGGQFTKPLIKDFLKTRFLGFIRNDSLDKWEIALSLNPSHLDIFAYIQLQSILKSLKDPPEIQHSEFLQPVRYWNFLNDCEKYYFELFAEMYDTKAMPLKPMEN